MNITYIIGNGFDLNLGLRTQYSDFYDYYNSIETDKEDIKELKRDINNKISLWSDLEKRLGEYTERIDTAENMCTIFNDIANNLKEYIIEQAKTIPETNEKLKSSLLKDLIEPESYFPRTDKEAILSFYNLFSKNNSSINIITLNYTSTIEKFLDYKENYKIETPITNSNHFIPEHLNIYHLHHSIEDRDTILLGVNDETQIKNEDFRNNQQLREYMIKPETNKMLKNGVDNDCSDLIAKTNLFVSFGVSFGGTDKLWWDKISNHIINYDNCKMLIFEYKPEISNANLRDIGDNERKVKEKFYSQTNITKDQLNKLNERIFVSINSPMFSDLKKHVFLLSDEQGSCIFNYSNNNGEFIIGSNKKKFTTKWSKASDSAIHAYNDAPDIKAIGLIRNVSDFNNININSVDFSSRTRTPQIGDAVIWKNINGFYAATKIIKVKDDSRNDDVDELTFQYVIFK